MSSCTLIMSFSTCVDDMAWSYEVVTEFCHLALTGIMPEIYGSMCCTWCTSKGLLVWLQMGIRLSEYLKSLILNKAGMGPIYEFGRNSDLDPSI